MAKLLLYCTTVNELLLVMSRGSLAGSSAYPHCLYIIVCPDIVSRTMTMVDTAPYKPYATLLLASTR
jgi:hypothetical protein